MNESYIWVDRSVQFGSVEFSSCAVKKLLAPWVGGYVRIQNAAGGGGGL